MINLLPDQTKQQIVAARTNVKLTKYIIFLGFAIAFLALACTTTYFILENNKTEAEKIIASGLNKAITYSSVNKKADAFRDNLATAKSILDQQTSYSDIVIGIGAALPSGVIIDELSVNNNNLGTPITIKARARSADDVAKLNNSFASSKLFSNFSVQSLATSSSDSSSYPVAISISLTVNKGVIQ